MGLLDKLFGFAKIRYVYGGSSSRSAPFSKEAYEQEIVRAVIDCIATHAAKAEALHVILDKDGRVKDIKHNSPYVKLLNQMPNPIMTGYDLKYKLIAQLQDRTTAMCYIKWNGIMPEMMIPIPFNNFEICEVKGGGYAVQFVDYWGTQRALLMEDVVVLRKFYNRRDASGDGNAPIQSSLDMWQASNDGLISALTVSNKVRGLFKHKKAMLAPDQVKGSQEEFAQRFQDAAENGGIVGIDAMEEYVPLDVKPWSASALQMKEIRESILSYWRISDSILRSDYDESQWQAFYEAVIEPLLIQMGQAFTNVCFTQTERDHGNRIVFNSSILMNTAMTTKVAIINASREIGLFTRNEVREMFGYSPIEGGDEIEVSLNYVKATDQSKYQTGDEENGQTKDDGAEI
jgi:HK97 family phage portal protein